MTSRTLEAVCELIVDSEHKTAPKDPDGLHPLIRTTDLGRAEGDFSSAQRVNSETHSLWTKRATPTEGDLIFAREAPVGGIAYVPKGIEPVLGQRTVLLRPNAQYVDGEFLMYRLAADDIQARMAELSSGATVPHLNMSDIRSFELPALPPLEVQRRVASTLSAFDELIEINRRRIDLLEAAVRCYFQHTVERPVRLTNDGAREGAGDSVGLLDGWKRCSLGEVASFKYGKSLPKARRRPGHVAVVSSAGIIDTHDTSLAEGPGLVVGRKGNVGSIWWIEDDFYAIDTTYFVESELPLEFLYWTLQGARFVNSHAAVPGLSRDQALSVDVVIPPADVMAEIASVHRCAFQAIAAYRRVIRAAQSSRDLLLNRLATGHLDISDIDLGVLAPAEAE